MFCKRSFLLLKDVIVILRSNIKRCFRVCIMAMSLSERNILCTLFISSVVHHITVVLANSIENIVLIYRSVL